jgi:hypothetical protein
MDTLVLSLASYLPFSGPDMRYVYGLFGAIGVVVVVMALSRVVARIRENQRVRQSSWRTYSKIAKLKGLSKYESQVLAGVLRRARVQRPTQVLGSLTQYEKLIDRAIAQGWIDDDELAHLEKARGKLVRTARPWDGQNRRQFERAPCFFELDVTGITKDALDEELKSAYTEGDERFNTAFQELLGEARPEGVRVQDLSAGGVALLAGDKDQFHAGDYLAFSTDDAGAPVDLTPVRGCILDVQQMEEQRQLILHVRFLPYDPELRKQVIRAVYEAAEQAKSETRSRKGRRAVGASTPAPRGARDDSGEEADS